MPQRRQWHKKLSMARPIRTLNHLERDFSAAAANTTRVTDITDIHMAENWLYLYVVLDLYSGLVVGWSISLRQDRPFVAQAVLITLWQRPAHNPSGHSALRSGLSIYLPGIPTVPGGASGYLLHECLQLHQMVAKVGALRLFSTDITDCY